ncbi:hypothetical protein [Serratia fonticola]
MNQHVDPSITRIYEAWHSTVKKRDLAGTVAPYSEFDNLVAWHRRLGKAIPAWRETGLQLEHRIIEIEAMLGKRAKSVPSGED